MFLSEQSGVGEAIVIGRAEDDVVEYPDAEDLRGFDQAVRAVTVFPRGSRIARRVIVQEYDGSRVLQNSGFEDFPWVHDRGGKASHADRVIADRPVLAVERDHEKELTVEGGELLAECIEEFAGVLVSRIAGEGILCLLHQHDSVSGEQVQEFLHA